jgi:hypothetical protein
MRHDTFGEGSTLARRQYVETIDVVRAGAQLAVYSPGVADFYEMRSLLPYYMYSYRLFDFVACHSW